MALVTGVGPRRERLMSFRTQSEVATTAALAPARADRVGNRGCRRDGGVDGTTPSRTPRDRLDTAANDGRRSAPSVRRPRPAIDFHVPIW